MGNEMLADILRGAMEQGASDIHIKTDRQVVIRKKGELEYLSENVIDAKDIHEVAESLLIESKLAELERERQVDSAYEFNGTRFRLNAFYDMKGLSVAIRVIPNKILDVRQIGFPYEEIWKDIVYKKKGLVLVCGPTNSGKTTTLASLIQEINRAREEHIVTIEDPIEYYHEPMNSMFSQREVGKDVVSFEKGLEGALREDPNVILIGEIRSKETARIALQAASSGHLVFSTLHSGDSGQAIWEYASRFPPEEQESARRQLASSLQYVLCQSLVPYESGAERTLLMEVANIGAKGANAMRNMIRKGEYTNVVNQIELDRDNCSIKKETHAKMLGLNLGE